MKTRIWRFTATGFLLLLLGSCMQEEKPKETASEFKVPVTYYTLDNGLKVILSQDTTSPTAIVAVYYNIGFRIEPKDRTGFAHLFEHMMFQQSENVGQDELFKKIQEAGGTLNGGTSYDQTVYYEVIPKNALEKAIPAIQDALAIFSFAFTAVAPPFTDSGKYLNTNLNDSKANGFV